MDAELQKLRDEIEAIDRQVLDALNRRLELVVRVRDHKRGTGARAIDARREAELLRSLVEGNPGPLSEPAVRSIFAAVLDVMKQESRSGARTTPAAAQPAAAPGISTLAIVGTGLVGASLGLAARRTGVARVLGWDVDATRLRAATGANALHVAAGSLAEAVREADLVVVAVPVGALLDATRQALDAAAADATVTDVGSTKRALVAEISDPRLVPGHPLAGGATGGPARAVADLFEGATWFLSPTETTDPQRLALVERFVTSLAARPVRLGAEAHDRLLALTSHLPHALANVLMRDLAAAGDDALEHAPPAVREMTRVAGANPAIWADIFVENADLISEQVAAHRERLGEVEHALRGGDRAFFERWIDEAASAHNRMLEFAYRTEARMLNRIRVRVPDKPGVLARITQTLGAAGINIEDFELRHVSPEYGGVLVVLVSGADNAELARSLLRREGYAAA